MITSQYNEIDIDRTLFWRSNRGRRYFNTDMTTTPISSLASITHRLNKLYGTSIKIFTHFVSLYVSLPRANKAYILETKLSRLSYHYALDVRRRSNLLLLWICVLQNQRKIMIPPLGTVTPVIPSTSSCRTIGSEFRPALEKYGYSALSLNGVTNLYGLSLACHCFVLHQNMLGVVGIKVKKTSMSRTILVPSPRLREFSLVQKSILWANNYS